MLEGLNSYQELPVAMPVQLLDSVPRNDADAGAVGGRLSAVDQEPSKGLRVGQESVERPQEVAGDGRAGFGLRRGEPGAHLDHDVYLETLGVPVVKQAKLSATVDPGLVDLGRHPALEHLAPQRVVAELVG